MDVAASPTNYLLHHNGKRYDFQQHTSCYQPTLHRNSPLPQLLVLWTLRVSTLLLQHRNIPFEPAVELQEEPEMTVKEKEISVIERNVNDLPENTRVKAKNAGTKVLGHQPSIHHCIFEIGSGTAQLLKRFPQKEK